MRKFLSIILVITALLLVSGCSSNSSGEADPNTVATELDSKPFTEPTIEPATEATSEPSTAPSTEPEETDKKYYKTGTDFGGDIALVGYERDMVGCLNSNIVIDKSGKELFTLEGMIAAYTAIGEEVSPSNNHIFAADHDCVEILLGHILPCKYVLNKQGDIILSPEKNGYDKIVCDIENFDQLADDGYLVVSKEESSYKGTEQYYWIIDFEGNEITERIKISDYSVYVVGDVTRNWTYIGDGIIDVGWFWDLKNNGELARDCPRDVDYIYPVFNCAKDENGNELFKLEAHARIYDFHNDKAGVVYDLEALYNKNEIYVGLINEKGKTVLQPFQIDFKPDGVCILEDKFIVYKACKYDFYDWKGNLLYDVTTQAAVEEELYLDSGCIRVRGFYVDYLKEDGTWLFG